MYICAYMYMHMYIHVHVHVHAVDLYFKTSISVLNKEVSFIESLIYTQLYVVGTSVVSSIERLSIIGSIH